MALDNQALKDHYRRHTIDLLWLNKPSQHVFRWRTNDNRWLTAKRRVRDQASFLKAIGNTAPRDVYVSTASWLNPIDLPRLRDNPEHYPVLLDHFVVFDIDVSPFSIESLEKAQSIARGLMEWLEEHENLTLRSVSFSGSKGFHLIYDDPDRDAFALPDLKEREMAVKAQRQALLDRVVEVGFEVDTKVTADTRRILRLPGSLHGSTGYACTRITVEALNGPLEDLLGKLYRHPSACDIPQRADPPPTQANTQQKPHQLPQPTQPSDEPWFKLRVNTHVQGTKNRHVMMMWLPKSWGAPLKAMERALDWIKLENLGPCSFWRHNERVLMLCPLAIPRPKLVKMYKRRGLHLSQSKLKQREHRWASLSPPEVNGPADIEPELMGIYGEPYVGVALYSRQHLELERRLGVRRVLSAHELCGHNEPSFEIVSMA
jgi:hypothetical protein